MHNVSPTAAPVGKITIQYLQHKNFKMDIYINQQSCCGVCEGQTDPCCQTSAVPETTCIHLQGIQGKETIAKHSHQLMEQISGDQRGTNSSSRFSEEADKYIFMLIHQQFFDFQFMRIVFLAMHNEVKLLYTHSLKTQPPVLRRGAGHT